VEIAQRALRSISRKEGEFSLLLDERFDILWHTESLSAILGWRDVVGRNGTEFVHPDDLELALATMVKHTDRCEHADLDPSFAPEASDIRLVDAAGAWHVFETTTWNHLDVADVRGVLCTCRRVPDRSDLGRAIEAMGSGASIDEVMPLVARLADNSMGGSEIATAFAWYDGDRLVTVCAGDGPPLHPVLLGCIEQIWTLGITSPTVVTDLDFLLDSQVSIAEDLGFKGAFLVPIEAPATPEVVGAMIAWGGSTIDFHAPPQSPLHVALRLAALAITDHHLKRELRWAAAHDPLTGLANRAEFARRLDRLAADDLVLLYIDLDDFKPINDAHGHHIGDRVLVEVGRRIAAVIESRDVVGRLGGDEFAVVCPGIADPVDGCTVGNRIIDAVRAPMLIDGLELSVGASVGVAVGAQPLIPALLAQRADEALYQAKNAGKNTVCLAA
jgi:diguanylate cyclase (GGDEF)-like protein